MSAYESMVVRDEAELELSNARCTVAMARKEAEREKVVELEKEMEVLRLKNLALEAKNVSMEDELLT